MKFITQIKSLLVVSLFAAGSLFAAAENTSSVEDVPVAQYTQLVVIASRPFITDMLQGLTSAHLRTALSSVRPDIIAIESPANLSDPLPYESFDLQKVVRPWAKQNQKKLFSVGYYESKYVEQMEQMIKELAEQRRLNEYQVIDDRLISTQKANKFTFKFINSEYHDKIWRLYHADIQKLYRKETPWQIWNQKIVENISILCANNPGKRIALVINSPQSYLIKDEMAKQPGVKVLSIENSLDFDKQRLAANFKAHDYIYALRPLMIDDFGRLPSDILAKLETYIHRLKQYPEFVDDANFFRGKMLLHRQKYRQAIMYFQPMTKMKPDVLLDFDNATPIRDSAMVYTAIAKLNLGQVDDAVNYLRAITRMKDVHENTCLWAHNIIQSLLPPGQAEVNIDLTK